jgi:hypothetical protein
MNLSLVVSNQQSADMTSNACQKRAYMLQATPCHGCFSHIGLQNWQSLQKGLADRLDYIQHAAAGQSKVRIYGHGE